MLNDVVIGHEAGSPTRVKLPGQQGEPSSKRFECQDQLAEVLVSANLSDRSM